MLYITLTGEIVEFHVELHENAPFNPDPPIFRL